MTTFDTRYLNELWEQILLMMKDRMTGPTFETWFSGTRVYAYDEDKNRIHIQTPNSFTKNWLSSHYTRTIETMFTALAEHEFTVQFDVASEAAEHSDKKEPKPAPQQGSYTHALTNALNPRYTFETFVIGASNRFAHAASLAVAETPAGAYNPLFIYGGVGLGKTHLMHAIGHHVLRRTPNA
jgi:chromosomal replication initiator protein